VEFLQSSGPGGAANQQRSLLGWRKEAVEVRPAHTRALLAISQALKSSTAHGASPIGQVVGAGNSTRAVRALKGGSVGSQHPHCRSLPGSWFLGLQLQYPLAVSKLLSCSYA